MESPGTRGKVHGAIHGHDGWSEKLRDRNLQKGSRISAGGLLGIKPGVNKVRDNLVYIGPSFIHEFGDSAHHMSMMRTVDFSLDEYGDEVTKGQKAADLPNFEKYVRAANARNFSRVTRASFAN